MKCIIIVSSKLGERGSVIEIEANKAAPLIKDGTIREFTDADKTVGELSAPFENVTVAEAYKRLNWQPTNKAPLVRS